jgi:hypothetical protein
VRRKKRVFEMYCGAKPKLAMVAVKACETSGLFITPSTEQLIRPTYPDFLYKWVFHFKVGKSYSLNYLP